MKAKLGDMRVPGYQNTNIVASDALGHHGYGDGLTAAIRREGERDLGTDFYRPRGAAAPQKAASFTTAANR